MPKILEILVGIQMQRRHVNKVFIFIILYLLLFFIKVCFGFFQLEYLCSLLEMVHLFWLEYSHWNLPFQFVTNWFVFKIWEFGKGIIKSGNSHSYWLPV